MLSKETTKHHVESYCCLMLLRLTKLRIEACHGTIVTCPKNLKKDRYIFLTCMLLVAITRPQYSLQTSRIRNPARYFQILEIFRYLTFIQQSTSLLSLNKFQIVLQKQPRDNLIYYAVQIFIFFQVYPKCIVTHTTCQ